MFNRAMRAIYRSFSKYFQALRNGTALPAHLGRLAPARVNAPNRRRPG